MVEPVKTDEKVDYKYIAIVISVSAILGLVLILTLGRYSWMTMQKSIATAKAQKLVLDATQERLDHLKELSSRKDELEAQNKTVLAALPQDKDVSTLFTQLEAIAKQSGMNITTVTETSAVSTTKGSATSGGLKELTYTATGKVPNYASLKQALAKFESSLRILSITNLSVDGTNGSNLNVQFDIKTYSRG
jgi:Tfp pilus assembly protein PilO